MSIVLQTTVYKFYKGLELSMVHSSVENAKHLTALPGGISSESFQ